MADDARSHHQIEPREDDDPPSDVPEAAGLPFTVVGPFEVWWLGFYGPVENYTDPDEYWTRKAYSWWGWCAAGKITERKNSSDE